MKNRAWLLCLLFLWVALPTSAKVPGWIVTTPDGKTIQGSDDDKLERLLKAYLKGNSNGKFVITSPEQSGAWVFVKKGRQVTWSTPGRPGTPEPADKVLAKIVQARAQGKLTACQSYMKNIANGVEMWSGDHQGAYPDKLSQIVPLYMKAIPTCPASRKDSYSSSYRKTGSPNSKFTFSCGSGHRGTAKGHPYYDSERGLQP